MLTRVRGCSHKGQTNTGTFGRMLSVVRKRYCSSGTKRCPQFVVGFGEDETQDRFLAAKPATVVGVSKLDPGIMDFFQIHMC